MSEQRVATRYAKSLISLAQEQGVLDQVHDDMLLFNSICRENRPFELMLNNPIINHEKKLAILKELFQDRMQEMTMSFFTIITRKNREQVLPEIAETFHIQYNALKGVEMATVSTVFPLDEELRNQFKSLIKKSSGLDSVELKEVVDEEIIGGYILKVGGMQIDDSLRGKLKELKLQFSHNPYLKGF